MFNQPPSQFVPPLVPPRAPAYALPTRLLLVLWLFSGFGLCGAVVLALTWQSLPTSTPIALASEPVRLSLAIDGTVRQIETRSATVGELLLEQGIQLNPYDAVSEPLFAPVRPQMNLRVIRARDVQVRIGEQSRIIQTAYDYPRDILRQMGVSLSEQDRVWLDGQAVNAGEVGLWGLPVNDIRIRPALQIRIDDEGVLSTLQTTAESVGDALYEAGIELFVTDSVVPDVTTALSEGMTVRISRALPVIIRVDGEEVPTRAQGTEVRAALAAAGISLNGLDYVIPPESAPLEAGMSIQVVRVSEQLESEDAPIAYDSTYQAEASMALDTRQVVQAGQAGILRRYTRVRYADGVEISREPAGEEVVQAPQNQIIAYGTNVVLYDLPTPEGTLQYWRKLRVYATSYHPAALGGDDVTAIGEKLRKGIVGANPRIIPYRTQVYVAGYGVGMIADTGGARSSPYWIDLGYSDADFVGWHRYVDIYLLAPVPANINYLLPEWTPMRGLPDRGN